MFPLETKIEKFAGKISYIPTSTRKLVRQKIYVTDEYYLIPGFMFIRTKGDVLNKLIH